MGSVGDIEPEGGRDVPMRQAPNTMRSRRPKLRGGGQLRAAVVSAPCSICFVAVARNTGARVSRFTNRSEAAVAETGRAVGDSGELRWPMTGFGASATAECCTRIRHTAEAVQGKRCSLVRSEGGRLIHHDSPVEREEMRCHELR